MTFLRNKRIAVLSNGLLSAYQVAFRDALRAAARRHGCDLLMVLGRELEHADPNERAQTEIFEWLTPASVDGVIALSGVLVNYSGPSALLRLLKRLRPVPSVSIGVGLDGVPSIRVDNGSGMCRVVQHLIDAHGARRIAFIGGPQDNQEAAARLGGYRVALASRGIPWRETIVRHGRFTRDTGEACMRELLAVGVEIDAVAAANDYMALGAMQVLREHGLSVPDQVRVVGFDDSPLARLAPKPLTSVAQPIGVMAERAFDALFATNDGSSKPPVSTFSPDLVLRHSCGCGRSAPRSTMESEPARRILPSSSRYQAALALCSAQLASASPWLRDCVEALSSAFGRELEGEGDAFIHGVEALVERAVERGAPLEELARALRMLGEAFEVECPGVVRRLEAAGWRALHLISEASARAEGRASLETFDHFISARYAGQRLLVSLDPNGIASALQRTLPELRVSSAALSLVDELEPERLRPLVISKPSGLMAPMEPTFPRERLVPEEFFERESACYIVMPLTFEARVYGVLAVGGAVAPFVCEMLRLQLSSALEIGRLQRRLVQETKARERADQLQLERELAVARDIQTALAPKRYPIQGFEVVAAMLPAREVGADYHDVIGAEGGAWLCVGDVTGHGLGSGLIMLMIQSMVTVLARTRRDASPAALLADLNEGAHAQRARAPRSRRSRDHHRVPALCRRARGVRGRARGSHRVSPRVGSHGALLDRRRMGRHHAEHPSRDS